MNADQRRGQCRIGGIAPAEFFCLVGRTLACATILLMVMLASAQAAKPKRILLLNSFGANFAPWKEYQKHFRTEFGKRAEAPVDIYEATLASARFADETEEAPFADYLHTVFDKRRLDLVVAIGGPAAAFFQRYQQVISPRTPVLLMAVEERRVPMSNLSANDTAVAVRADIVGAIENILRVLPKTSHIVIVLGNSPIERYWQGQVRAAIAPYADRVTFTWFNDLSFDEMLRRSATLPPHSAIFFGLLLVDAAGVPQEEGGAVDRLHGAANAPIFSYNDAFFGRGIVGGPLTSVEETGRRAADVALRILRGEKPSDIRTEPVGPGRPRFDWRELRRWNISEAALPAGSTIEFREPTVFEQYRNYIIAAFGLLLLEGIFIVALLLNRRRLEREKVVRQHAEKMARDFSGRLITAQEDERSRLARELHDDVTQRLALLAIEAGRGSLASDDNNSRIKMRDGLIRLSEDVHAFSYRLHPSIVEDLGLNEALKTECERFSEAESIPVEVKLQTGEETPSQQLSLCLFRVAQEALRNVGRHSHATTAEVSLRRLDDGFELCIRDDGVGFDPKLQRDHVSLGLASMQQRVYLLGGELNIDSRPGRGTTVLAWIPFMGEHHASSARTLG